MQTQPHFKPFDPHKAVIVYRRNLPHWRQDGATYFVTYRLADSVPRHVLDAWDEERRIWFTVHGIDQRPQSDAWREAYESIPLRERRAFERHNERRTQEYLDQGRGSCILKDPSNGKIVDGAMHFFHGTRCWTGDLVVMPNHAHALITPSNEYELEHILQSIKRYASREIGKRTVRKGTLWQRDTYDHIVRDSVQLRAFRKYIARNPAKASVKPGEYIYRRAVWLDEFADFEA